MNTEKESDMHMQPSSKERMLDTLEAIVRTVLVIGTFLVVWTFLSELLDLVTA